MVTDVSKRTFGKFTVLGTQEVTCRCVQTVSVAGKAQAQETDAPSLIRAYP
jgi:hypothetical protein